MNALPEQSDLIDDIQTRLESQGWQAESGEGWRWVDHTYQNDEAKLRVRYLPKVATIRFDFESEEHLAQLSISFADSPDQILDLITASQSTLSEATWESFIASLINVSPRVVSLADEEGGGEDVVSNPADGVAALREIEWE